MHRPSVFVLVVALAAPVAAQTPAPKPPARHAAPAAREPMTEASAHTRLSNAIERDGVYAPMARACMTFVTVATTPAAFEIDVREKHGGRCGGDPAASPVLDRVRVDRTSGAIGVWDVLEEDWYSWAEFKRHRTGQGQ